MLFGVFRCYVLSFELTASSVLFLHPKPVVGTCLVNELSVVRDRVVSLPSKR